jgi:hypothetical protein
MARASVTLREALMSIATNEQIARRPLVERSRSSGVRDGHAAAAKRMASRRSTSCR